MQLLRKISPRTVFGSKTEILELVLSDKVREHLLYRVFGICNGTRSGDNEETGKPWTALLGQFEAHNLKTGETFQSGVAFLPNYVADIIAGKLTPETVSVKFAFEITAKFDESAATSYVYGASPLIDAAENDPLTELVKSVPTAPKQIEKQKKSA